jgi:hypothetical protein
MDLINKKKKAEVRVINGKESRCCTKCKEWKPFSEFYKDNRVNSSLPIGSICKACEKIRMKDYMSNRYKGRRSAILPEKIQGIFYPTNQPLRCRGINSVYQRTYTA